MPTLYAIVDELKTLDELLEESGGEVTPEIEAWIAEYGEVLADKADRIGGYWRQLEADAEAHKKEEDFHATRKMVAKRKLERLKALVHFQMTRSGRTEFKGTLFTPFLAQNGGKLPLRLLVEDPERFPAECRVVTVSVDKEAVRRRLEGGDDVELAGLAALGARGCSVRLR